SRLALTPADLQGGSVTKEGYVADQSFSPVSEYARTLSPAGPFLVLQEQVALFHSATEASYVFSVLASTLSSPRALGLFGSGGGMASYRPTPVAVAAGDESRAVRARVGGSGGQANEGLVLTRVGATTELVLVAAPAAVPISASALRDVATAAASRARAGLHR